MQEPTIGIKVANGSYFPVIEEKSVGKKRLILTTVNDRQESVKIDLYKSEEETLENALYIGSLILESIQTGEKGEPEIELILGIDEEGNLTATAGDLGSGERQSLSVSMDTLSEEREFEIPDFDLDASIEPTSEVSSLEEEEFSLPEEPEEEAEFEEEPFEADFGLEEEFGAEEETFEEELGLEEEFGEEYSEEEPFEEEAFTAVTEEGPAEEAPEKEPQEERRVRPALIAVFVFLGVVIIGLLAFLLFRSFQGDEAPPLEARRDAARTEQPAAPEPAETEPEGTGAEPAEPVEAEEPGERDAAGEGPAAAAAEADAEERAGETAAGAEEPAAPGMKDADTLGGVWYWVKWGDTLWDLSYSFYRTPWLYGLIARVNNIKNPDLIYANSKLYIPEK